MKYTQKSKVFPQCYFLLRYSLNNTLLKSIDKNISTPAITINKFTCYLDVQCIFFFIYVF